ncbi:hypothetical protein IAR50_005259 [Cryptococcus sp. DSM 104548]
MEVQISRLSAEYRSVAALSDCTICRRGLIALLEKAVEHLFADIGGESGLTYGLKLVVCQSKNASRRAAKVGGSHARAGYHEYDNEAVEDVVKALISHKEAEVKKIVQAVCSKYLSKQFIRKKKAVFTFKTGLEQLYQL